ncbi:hypothetical protein [Streptomyces sp. NPDC001914]|uniref:hypothetical protein n=1 Tax=Streptomyces sp. NPDC001914 TaxID=3364623 RepID=UPI0036D07E10
MSWDDVTLVILASFGCVMLLLTQIAEVLSKIPEIIRAWREIQRAFRAGPDGSPHVQGSHEAADPASVSVEGTPQEPPQRPTGRGGIGT